MAEDCYKGSAATLNHSHLQDKFNKLAGAVVAREVNRQIPQPERIKKRRCAECGVPVGKVHQGRCKLKGEVE